MAQQVLKHSEAFLRSRLFDGPAYFTDVYTGPDTGYARSKGFFCRTYQFGMRIGPDLNGKSRIRDVPFNARPDIDLGQVAALENAPIILCRRKMGCDLIDGNRTGERELSSLTYDHIFYALCYVYEPGIFPDQCPGDTFYFFYDGTRCLVTSDGVGL